MLPTVVETIGQTLALQYVGLALADDGPREAMIAAEYGIPGADFLAFPLVHQGDRRSASSGSHHAPASASESATTA